MSEREQSIALSGILTADLHPTGRLQNLILKSVLRTFRAERNWRVAVAALKHGILDPERMNYPCSKVKRYPIGIPPSGFESCPRQFARRPENVKESP